MGWEGKPAPYQVERVDVLRRELADVASEFEALSAKELPALNGELKSRNLRPIAVDAPASEHAPLAAGGRG